MLYNEHVKMEAGPVLLYPKNDEKESSVNLHCLPNCYIFKTLLSSLMSQM